MKSIAFFNNKGGVGKTTLSTNFASYLSLVRNKRVLLVDCDPQCNATQLIMGEEYVTALYWKHPPDEYEETTIKDILTPIEQGDASISGQLVPILSSKNRFNVDLIPGHPGLSMMEDILSRSWHDSVAGDLGGLRKSNWNSSLLKCIEKNYDFVIFDIGPSLGSINRTVLLGCDFFLSPMGTDIFSMLGIKNIAIWLNKWIGIYENSLIMAKKTEANLAQFQIKERISIKNGFIGFTMQQYIAKSKEGIRRPTKAYEEIISQFPKEVNESLAGLFKESLTIEDLKLGNIPHLYSLVPLAQSVSSPLFAMNTNDGLVGSQFRQKEDYKKTLGKIIENTLRNIEK